MRPDPALRSSALRRLGGMVLRLAWAIGLFVGLSGCRVEELDIGAACLEDHDGDARCCPEGTYPDHGTCCERGAHVVSDVEHPDWRVCVWDEDPCADAGACLDAGADAEAGAATP
jgi:hypothetical protein